MTGTDIRAWAREKGLDVNARGPVNKAVVELYENEFGPAVAETVFEPPADAAPAMTEGETIPQVKRGGLKGKLASVRQPRTPSGPRGRRQSLERVGGLLWSGLSNVLAGTGMLPAARVVAMQAPIAGMVIEDSLKGSAVDKIAQPVARLVGKGGDLGALLGPIVMVTAIQKRPEMYGQLKPYLEDALWSYVEVAGPHLKKLEERKAKRAEMIGEGFDMEALIQGIFAPQEGVPDAGQAVAAEA